ncbi:MAG: PTS sugar transporter subunit IIA [Candidatus Aureabacteria bacterium]|nr:PTS sugar transporter subunit IIA [Candidatus Auribacterota bacterium]
MNRQDYAQESDILTLLEIADYLKVSQKTIMRMINKGNIKGFKVGGQWRFLRPVVDEWITDKIQNLPKNGLAKVIKTAKKIIPLSKLITEKSIILNIKPGSKTHILSQIAYHLYENKLIKDVDDFLKKLILREEMISTAVSRGVAFPHLRKPSENKNKEPFIALAVCPEGTEFDSIDGLLTHVFALVCSKSELTHLRLLAKISWLFKQENILDKIIKSNSKEEILSFVKKTDVEIAINV